MDQLPFELRRGFAEFLSFPDLVSLIKTCKHWSSDAAMLTKYNFHPRMSELLSLHTHLPIRVIFRTKSLTFPQEVHGTFRLVKGSTNFQMNLRYFSNGRRVDVRKFLSDNLDCMSTSLTVSTENYLASFAVLRARLSLCKANPNYPAMVFQEILKEDILTATKPDPVVKRVSQFLYDTKYFSSCYNALRLPTKKGRIVQIKKLAEAMTWQMVNVGLIMSKIIPLSFGSSRARINKLELKLSRQTFKSQQQLISMRHELDVARYEKGQIQEKLKTQKAEFAKIRSQQRDEFERIKMERDGVQKELFEARVDIQALIRTIKLIK